MKTLIELNYEVYSLEEDEETGNLEEVLMEDGGEIVPSDADVANYVVRLWDDLNKAYQLEDGFSFVMTIQTTVELENET